MASKGYTTKAAVENYMLLAIDSDFNDQIDEWIEGVETEMDKMADRQLMADDEDAEYKYDGNGKKSLMVDDFVSITSVEDGDSTITSDCFFYPANKNPKWRIESEQSFTSGLQNITVTGKRGYATEENFPRDLKFAATVLVAGIVNHSNKLESDIKSESLGRYTVTYADNRQKSDFDRAMNIIKSYRRLR